MNIHFTDPKPGEMEMIAAAGFKWVRMDLTWSGTERQKGEYDFSAYNRLAAALDAQKMRAVFILDYGNPLYADPGDKHPFTSRAGTPEFREAYAKWAVAAVSHFKGKNYLWELWNELNHAGFWKPKPIAADYIVLAKTACEAVSNAAPDEALIGPATSTIDLPFLEACFKAGLLDHWCAVSVHPYRQKAPETVEEEYRSLRLLIRKYATKDKTISILSGEWGYSTAWPSLGKDEPAREEQQAKYLARQFLTNIANDIPLSIWYDWRDDGDDPKEAEHRFGIVRRKHHEGREPVLEAKPAYVAAKTLMEQLGGFKLNKRLGMGREEYYHLLFEKGDVLRSVVWKTVGSEPMAPWIEARPGTFATVNYLGQPQQSLSPEKEFGRPVHLPLSTAPLYLLPQGRDDVLRLAAAWKRFPLEVVVEPGQIAEIEGVIRNPLDREIEILGRESKLRPGEEWRFSQKYGPSRDERVTSHHNFMVPTLCHLWQTTFLLSTKPLRLVPLPAIGQTLLVRVENPSGDRFRGALEIYYDGSGDSPKFGPITAKPKRVSVGFTPGQIEQMVAIPLGASPPPAYSGSICLYEGNDNYLKRIFSWDDLNRSQESVGWAPIRFERVDDLGKYSEQSFAGVYTVSPEGDAAVAASHDLSIAPAPAGLPDSKQAVLRLKYGFGAGWKFLRLVALAEELKSINGVPAAVGWWVFGDGRGCVPRIRVTDRSGQTFQASGPNINWTGWRYIAIPIRSRDDLSSLAPSISHWGGSNDGLIDSPIKWETLFLLDNVERKALEGEIYLGAPTLIY